MTLIEFVAALNAQHGNENYSFSVQHGSKYAKVIRTSWGARSVYCFVDNDGNVLKAAGWKAPAKGARASLATLDIADTDPYGSWLYAR